MVFHMPFILGDHPARCYGWDRLGICHRRNRFIGFVKDGRSLPLSYWVDRIGWIECNEACVCVVTPITNNIGSSVVVFYPRTLCLYLFFKRNAMHNIFCVKLKHNHASKIKISQHDEYFYISKAGKHPH